MGRMVLQPFLRRQGVFYCHYIVWLCRIVHMQKRQIEGIVVHTIPFKDYDRIVTLFAPHEGLIKLVAKGVNKKGKGYGMEPLAFIEVLCSEGRSGLYTCYESAVLDSHLPLRSSLSVLNAACDMLQTISATQQPGKPAVELFQLLTASFMRLPATDYPATLASSFRLKTLRFEGLISPHFYCAACGISLNEKSFYGEGGAYCELHAPQESVFFTQEEQDLFLLLAFCRDFALLRDLPLNETFHSKICHLFDQLIMRAIKR